MRSKGWPTATAQTPPNPPAAKDFSCPRSAFSVVGLDIIDFANAEKQIKGRKK